MLVIEGDRRLLRIVDVRVQHSMHSEVTPWIVLRQTSWPGVEKVERRGEVSCSCRGDERSADIGGLTRASLRV